MGAMRNVHAPMHLLGLQHAADAGPSMDCSIMNVHVHPEVSTYLADSTFPEVNPLPGLPCQWTPW